MWSAGARTLGHLRCSLSVTAVIRLNSPTYAPSFARQVSLLRANSSALVRSLPFAQTFYFFAHIPSVIERLKKKKDHHLPMLPLALLKAAHIALMYVDKP